MPQALQRIGLPLGPLRHCGLVVAPQWQHGPHNSCLLLPRRAPLGVAAGGVAAPGGRL
jgi:hypothetical protein